MGCIQEVEEDPLRPVTDFAFAPQALEEHSYTELCPESVSAV